MTRLEIVKGPSKGDLVLSLAAQPDNQIVVDFHLKNPGDLQDNTPDERIVKQLFEHPTLGVAIYGLELIKENNSGVWAFKAVHVSAKGIRFVGRFSVVTRKGWIELENLSR